MHRDMQLSLPNGGHIVVHCKQLAALQELNHQTPGDFIAYINALVPVPTDIAVTLRVHQVVHQQVNYPPAMTYIQDFVQAGWQVANIALLGVNACALQGLPLAANIHQLPNSHISPTNWSAHQVRQVWGWL